MDGAGVNRLGLLAVAAVLIVAGGCSGRIPAGKVNVVLDLTRSNVSNDWNPAHSYAAGDTCLLAADHPVLPDQGVPPGPRPFPEDAQVTVRDQRNKVIAHASLPDPHNGRVVAAPMPEHFFCEFTFAPLSVSSAKSYTFEFPNATAFSFPTSSLPTRVALELGDGPGQVDPKSCPPGQCPPTPKPATTPPPTPKETPVAPKPLPTQSTQPSRPTPQSPQQPARPTPKP